MSDDESWRDSALCAQVSPDLWFPDPGASSAKAREICGECPVREQCLFDALYVEQELWLGIRGGLTPKARRDLLKRRAA